MIKKGVFAIVNGIEYRYTYDKNANSPRIIAISKESVDDTFEDLFGTGVYSKTVKESDISEKYSLFPLAKIENDLLNIERENETQYLVSSDDELLISKYSMKRVDKYSYSTWIEKSKVSLVYVKE